MSKKTSLVVLVILLLAIVAGATFAAFTSRKEITSVVEIGSVKLSYTFDVPNVELKPGVSVDSKATIRNVGSTPAYIRVSLVPTWDGYSGNNSVFDCTVPSGSKWVKVIEGSNTYYYYNGEVGVQANIEDFVGQVTINGDNTGNEIAEKRVKFDLKIEAIQSEYIDLRISGSTVTGWPSNVEILPAK